MHIRIYIFDLYHTCCSCGSQKFHTLLKYQTINYVKRIENAKKKNYIHSIWFTPTSWNGNKVLWFNINISILDIVYWYSNCKNWLVETTFVLILMANIINLMILHRNIFWEPCKILELQMTPRIMELHWYTQFHEIQYSIINDLLHEGPIYQDVGDRNERASWYFN